VDFRIVRIFGSGSMNIERKNSGVSAHRVRAFLQESAARCASWGKRKGSGHKTSVTRSRAVEGALERESHRAASHEALSRQAKESAMKPGKQSRQKAAAKASRTREAA